MYGLSKNRRQEGGQEGAAVAGLRHFGRGQKITFLAGYFRGAWSLQKLVSRDSWKDPAKKLFFGIGV